MHAQDTARRALPDSLVVTPRPDTVPRPIGPGDGAHHRWDRWRNNNIFQWFRNAITKGRPDSIVNINTNAPLNTKSESPFKPFEGKIIRHIYIRGYGFEQTFTDTARRLQYFGTNLLNHLHRKTRDWVIRDGLFIKEGTPLSAFKVADNERLIRSQNFIQDARILVQSQPDNSDSVDLVVVVKDLFSISGAIGSLGYPPFSIRGNAQEANFLGMGQRVLVGANVEQSRTPTFGPQLLYSKSNIGHSFINATASYTQINSNIYNGSPTETAWFVQLDRPLYAPYAHLAGGFRIGDFQNFNVYHQADSLFFKYRYHTHDGWIGWNIGSNRFLSNTSVRDRRFLAFRYFRNDFDSIPRQLQLNPDPFNFRFNDREAALTSFTFFRQDFYKTNYVYGFGTTEDLPVGYNVAITSGWYRQLFLDRLYAGVDANEFVVTKKGRVCAAFSTQRGIYVSRSCAGCELPDRRKLLQSVVHLGEPEGPAVYQFQLYAAGQPGGDRSADHQQCVWITLFYRGFDHWSTADHTPLGDHYVSQLPAAGLQVRPFCFWRSFLSYAGERRVGKIVAVSRNRRGYADP